MKTHTFLVTIRADTRPSFARAFVRDALVNYRDDPILNLSARAVTVKPVTKQAKKKPKWRTPRYGEVIPQGARCRDSEGGWVASRRAGDTCGNPEEYRFPV